MQCPNKTHCRPNEGKDEGEFLVDDDEGWHVDSSGRELIDIADAKTITTMQT